MTSPRFPLRGIPSRRLGPRLQRRPLLLLLALLATGLPATLAGQPLWAQGDVGTAVEDGGLPWGRLGRAVRLARTAAEARNGGGTAYSPSACMERADGGDCLIEDGDGGFVFRILGGPPGWQQAGQPPSRETVVRISSDGRRVLAIDYDGSPRPWKSRPKRRSGSWS
ncbi:MAG: hypothetical protein VKK43_10825 [Synechococcaceae cyanobacterium]|nr:hypothetical protein [Synechococcaceae cyanobacterium]